jgi:glycosyltransferase involved in cell wall biosynthesis
MSAPVVETRMGVVIVGQASSNLEETAHEQGRAVEHLSPEAVPTFLLTTSEDWAIVAGAEALPDLALDRFKTPLLVDMLGMQPSRISDPAVGSALGRATALFGVSRETAQWLEDHAAISPQVLQGFDTALRVAESPFLMVVGAGLGNVLQATPAIRAVSDTLGHPIDVFVTNPRAVSLIGRAQSVNLALADRAMLESRHYDRAFVTSSAGRFVPPVGTDELATQRPRFEMTKAGEWMHETAFYTLGLTDLLPEFRMSNSQSQDYFVSDYAYRTPRSGIVGICSGVRPGVWERRGWPHFEELAGRLRQLGYQTWSFGTKDEYVPGTVDKTGTELRQNLVDMQMCDYFVATDGGIYHMAEGLGIPTLVLFGPTSVIKNGPNRATTRIAHTLEPCSPCHWKIDFHRCQDPVCTSNMGIQLVMDEFLGLVAETNGEPSSGIGSATAGAELVRRHEKDNRNVPYRQEFAPAYTEESFSLYPRSTRAAERVVMGRGKLGDLARVDEVTQHVDSIDGDMRHATASALLDGGDYERLVADGLEHLEAEPDDTAMRLLVMRALAKQERWQGLVDLSEDVVFQPDTSPFETAELSFLRGVALRELGSYARAVSCFEDAMGARPGVRRYVEARDSLRTDLYRHADLRMPIDSGRQRIAALTPPQTGLPDWANDLSRRAALFNYHTTELDLLEHDAKHIDSVIAIDGAEIPPGFESHDPASDHPPRDERMRVVLFAHHHLARWEPHGGELSMLAVVEDLVAKGIEVRVVVANRKNRQTFTEQIGGVDYVVVPHHRFEATVDNVLDLYRPDIALMWGKPSLAAAPICKERGVPTLVFVRYWYAVCDGPYDGDLLADPIDEPRLERQRKLLQSADAVITNARYVSQVIERLHGALSSVAYVPVHPPPPTWVSPAPSDRPHVTLVNPRKAGGQRLLLELAQRLPTVPFLSIGYPTIDMPPNVTVRSYDNSPYYEMLDSTNVLLFPFDEDPCGTGRVPLEALHCGIPVVAAARGGLGEVVPEEWLVQWDDMDAWASLVEQLYFGGDEADRRRARGVAERFDPEAGLRLVEETVDLLTGGRWKL